MIRIIFHDICGMLILTSNLSSWATLVIKRIVSSFQELLLRINWMKGLLMRRRIINQNHMWNVKGSCNFRNFQHKITLIVIVKNNQVFSHLTVHFQTYFTSPKDLYKAIFKLTYLTSKSFFYRLEIIKHSFLLSLYRVSVYFYTIRLDIARKRDPSPRDESGGKIC